MSDRSERPWLTSFAPGDPAELPTDIGGPLDLFDAALATDPDQPLLHYFGTTLTVGDVHRASEALAAGLGGLGIGPGGRVVVFLQSCPQFVVTAIAVWKLGATLVPANPMLRSEELAYVVGDSGATVVVALASLWRDVVVRTDLSGAQVVVTSDAAFVGDAEHPSVIPPDVGAPRGAIDFGSLLSTLPVPLPARPSATDLAAISYTSGTTGRPKGAMNTHGAMAFNAVAKHRWFGIDERDVLLGVAPLFHITGLVAHLTLALVGPNPLVLPFRFAPDVVIDLIERYRPTFSIGAITAYLAMLGHPDVDCRDLSSLVKVYSGGAPVSAATVDEFRRRVGPTIRNAYGLTESTAATHLVPRHLPNRVDPTFGALSIGVPYFNTDVVIAGEDGTPQEPGAIGELVVRGPQLADGYWLRPDATAEAFTEQGFRTGDVGFMDADGWFYIVDRSKDMIIASGYKVWPREVEDVLFGHPAVREAAVVGVPDEYRGETVQAFIVAREGEPVDPSQVIEFCRQRLAAYKVPRRVTLVAELPKTASGKVLRRVLRDGP